ncbi:MAG TPA: GGDEF domain-containing protein [Acidimicrobiales bacterium]|nr:GGDEF domain-containing protein [Acidimicrobiales bacterium]
MPLALRDAHLRVARDLLDAELVVLARRIGDGRLEVRAVAVAEPSAAAEDHARRLLLTALRADPSDGVDPATGDDGSGPGVAVALAGATAAIVAVGTFDDRRHAEHLLAVVGREAIADDHRSGAPAAARVEELSRRVEIESTIADAVGDLVRDDPTGLDERIVAGLGRIGGLLGATAAFVRRVPLAGGRSEITHVWRSPDGATIAGASDRDDMRWLARRLAAQPVVLLRSPLADADIATSERQLLERHETVAYLRVGAAGSASVVALLWRQGGPETIDELAAVAPFAEALGGALVRDAAEALARAQSGVLELIARSSPLPDTLAAVCRLVDQRCAGARAVVFLVGSDGGAELAVAPGLPRSRRERLARTALDPDLPVARVLASGEALALVDPPADSAGLDDPAAATSGWWVPIIGNRAGEVLGVIGAVALAREPVEPDPVVLDAASLAAIAIERHRDEAWLAFQATHDPLTGVANRAHLVGRVELALARARRTGRRVGVLFCDLDRFKEVNDTHGHDEGDRLLLEVARRLSRVVRPTDTVARFGGDEFVVLLDDVADDDDALVIARRVSAALRTPPLEVAGVERVLTTSIGVAISTARIDNPEALIRDADAALYRAKRQGRDRVELFRDDERDDAPVRDRLGEELATAIRDHELELAYQPIIDAVGGGVVGIEALLRWRHPRRGPLVPAEFLAVADSSGLIVAIGEWVVATAAADLAAWIHARPTLAAVRLHLNLSARQLAGTAAVDAIAEALVAAPVAVDRITLEVGERAFGEVPPSSLAALERFAALGVRLAVDDFGVGTASLTALRRFPVAEVRIDGALARTATGADVDRHVLRAVIELAHALDLEVSAEGVESAEQLAALRDLGVDTVQGRHVGAPMPAEELARLLLDPPVAAPS